MVAATAVSSTLQTMLRERRAIDAKGQLHDIHSAIPPASVAKIQQLIREFRPHDTLEIGCAMGMSTLAIMEEVARTTAGRHVAIDPNQTGEGPDQWHGIGVTSVRRAGLSDRFELLEQPSYLGLPTLLQQGRRFDFIFIDGWHSFDFAFVDWFFSDLLLNEKGVLVFDDAQMPQVHHVCTFVETHKAYRRLGPPDTGAPLSPPARLRQRRLLKRGNGCHPEWGSVRAYQKMRSTTVPWNFFESTFYPWFRPYRWWMRLRGLQVHQPI